jgi:hypothetical protein
MLNGKFCQGISFSIQYILWTALHFSNIADINLSNITENQELIIGRKLGGFTPANMLSNVQPKYIEINTMWKS